MNSRALAMFFVLAIFALIALDPVSAGYAPNSTSNSTETCVPEVNPRRYHFVNCVKLVNKEVDLFGAESVLVECERDVSSDKKSVSHSMNNIAGYLHCVKYDSDWSLSTSFKSFLEPKLATTFACTADNLPFDYPVCKINPKYIAIIGGCVACVVVLAIAIACCRVFLKRMNRVSQEPLV